MTNIFSRRALVWLLLASPVLYAATCSSLSENMSGKFARINIGDTKVALISMFGKPSYIEHPDILFSRYADKKCQDHCVERLWFENRLTLDTEAWSFEIDKDNRVINKSHWVSP